MFIINQEFVESTVACGLEFDKDGSCLHSVHVFKVPVGLKHILRGSPAGCGFCPENNFPMVMYTDDLFTLNRETVEYIFQHELGHLQDPLFKQMAALAVEGENRLVLEAEINADNYAISQGVKPEIGINFLKPYLMVNGILLYEKYVIEQRIKNFQKFL